MLTEGIFKAAGCRFYILKLLDNLTTYLEENKIVRKCLYLIIDRHKGSIHCMYVALVCMIVQDIMLLCHPPCSFWQKMCMFFEIAFFSGSEWCRDRGSQRTTGCHTKLLCNLASSASPSHRVPIRSFPPK